MSILFIVYRNEKKLEKGIEEAILTEDTERGAENSLRNIIVVFSSKAAIALEVYHDIQHTVIKPFDKVTPRLFCDSQLVGSHDFPFPVILNSPKFNINEPRNGFG